MVVSDGFRWPAALLVEARLLGLRGLLPRWKERRGTVGCVTGHRCLARERGSQGAVVAALWVETGNAWREGRRSCVACCWCWKAQG